MKPYKKLSNREYKKRTDILSFILFLILIITLGYVVFNIVAHFYLKGVENALYEVPIRDCIAYRGAEPEEFTILYLGDNTLIGRLVPVIETAEVDEVKTEGLIYKIIYCESTNNPTAKNPDSSAYGYCQMTTPTWNYCMKKWGLNLDRNNPNDQLYACDRLLKEEGVRHWQESYNCWSNL